MEDNIIKATISLNDGRKIRIELYPEVAPISVSNFVTQIESGYYEGLCFHRVIPGFMIQGGGMTATGSGADMELAEKGGLTPIKGEFDSNGVKNPLKHTAGVLSMARTNVMNSATSQFFLCVAACDFLDGNYAAFGRVCDKESLDIAIAISNVPTTRCGYHDDVPVTPIVITGITLDT